MCIHLSELGGILGGIGAIATAGIAWVQLSNLNKSLNASNLMTIFEIEFELNRRKERLSEIRQNCEKSIFKFNSKKTTADDKLYLKMLDSHRKEAQENYYNVFDRLCYFILKKKLGEDDFRLEYREMLTKTIQEDKENIFRTGTKFSNMVKLYHEWKEK